MVRIVAENHEVANHLTADQPSIRLSPAEFERQLLEAGREIPKVVGFGLTPALALFIMAVAAAEAIFDRMAIEIARGCTRGCRFCQAGMVFRPVRERSLAELLETVDKIMVETGHEEIGLLSLSSSDYSQIGPWVKAIADKYGDRAGYRYSEAEDGGIFCSNDPAKPIVEMVRELKLELPADNIERNRRLQEELRGGPPGLD